ncbi:MAG: YggU family protein [Proteobacteria bacterium]|nr:YggU family protein [Pseudomonadota bacterium]MBU1709550.1 YggU family protein [Pseudomonadota bacterium]
MIEYLRQEKDGSISIRIYVQPRASQNQISGLHGDAVKICITAPPVDGKANTAVISTLAKLFKIPKSAVTLKSGSQNRNKLFVLSGITLDDAYGILEKEIQ